MPRVGLEVTLTCTTTPRPRYPLCNHHMCIWNPFYRPPPPKKESLIPSYDEVTNRITSLPAPTLVLSAFTLGLLSAWGTSFVYKRYFRRLKNVEWITPDMFQRKRWVKGRVTRFVLSCIKTILASSWYRDSVGDADNFRIYHTPGIGWRWPIRFRTIPSTTKGDYTPRLCD